MSMKIFIYLYHSNVSKKTQSWLEQHCTKTENPFQAEYLFNGDNFRDFSEKWDNNFLSFKGKEPNIWNVYITDHHNFSQR